MSDRQRGRPVAAGLFGYSIRDGRVSTFIPLPGYVRELEQLPNFTLPSMDRFVAHYVTSNLGVTRSSS
ncbi:hypothetical protein [Parasphingorhabdus litoris]|uniref:hypothetical protein n=1 Tax=Parasphingorhabdus litoris TaxID=394733 RepID=UPI001E589E71|nr:hypothetical protein [Parasphingorhabdus litoris]